MDVVSKISTDIVISGDELCAGGFEFSLGDPSFSVEVRETYNFASLRGAQIVGGVAFVCLFFAGEFAALGGALTLPLVAILLYLARGISQSQSVEVNITDKEKSYRCFLTTMQAEHFVAEIPTETFDWKYWPRSRKRSS